MNTIEIMWSKVRKTMQETRPDFPPRHRYAVCTLESDACVEVAV
jgi:hypothetical protein